MLLHCDKFINNFATTVNPQHFHLIFNQTTLTSFFSDLFSLALLNISAKPIDTVGDMNNSQGVPQTRHAKVYQTLAPEPGPRWREAKRHWGFVWELHWIGIGLAYALLACGSLWSIIRRSPAVNRFARRPLFNAINWLLVALGITRSMYLWLEPYESAQHAFHCPLWIIRPLFGIAFPCLMSAFCLVHVAFLEASNIKLGFSKLKSVRFVVSIIFVHFAVVIVSDTTSAFKADRIELLIVCQSFFIVWGIVNSTCFIYSGSRVVSKSYNVRNKICPKESVAEITKRTEQRNDFCGVNEVKHSPKYNETPAQSPNANGRGAQPMHQLELDNHLINKITNASAPKQDINSTSLRNKGALPTNGERAIRKVVGITLMTSFLSITCCALQMYSLFGVHSIIYSEIVSPKPWPWFAFQTSFRLVELLMAFTLSFCINRSCFDNRRRCTSPFRLQRREKRVPRVVVEQENEIMQHGVLKNAR